MMTFSRKRAGTLVAGQSIGSFGLQDYVNHRGSAHLRTDRHVQRQDLLPYGTSIFKITVKKLMGKWAHSAAQPSKRLVTVSKRALLNILECGVGKKAKGLFEGALKGGGFDASEKDTGSLFNIERFHERNHGKLFLFFLVVVVVVVIIIRKGI
jgi:hypothetical protein